MVENAVHGFGRAFCDALASHDPGRLSPPLDENIEWTVFGPIDLFGFFGQRHGKTAVLELCRTLSKQFQLLQCERTTLANASEAAGLVRLTVADKRTTRTLSLRLAHFVRFRAGKVISLRPIFDSFDAAEQALGYQISLTAVA